MLITQFRILKSLRLKPIGLVFFLLHGALVFGLSYRIHQRMAHEPGLSKYHFSPHIERMDSGYYRGIAQYGYQFSGLTGQLQAVSTGKGKLENIDRVFFGVNSDTNNVGFFPLYPYLARMFFTFGVPIEWALTLVTWIACVLFWQLWFCLTFESSFGRRTQFWGGLAFLFLPTSFYLWVSYSEALVLSVTLLTLKGWIEDIDGNLPPFRAARGLALWGLLKVTVIPVTVAIFLFSLYWPFRSRTLKQASKEILLSLRNHWQSWLGWLTISFSGLLFFIGYCAIRFNEPFLYAKMQRYSWHHADAGLASILNIDNFVGTLFKAQTSGNGFFAFVPLILGVTALAKPKREFKLSAVMILAVMLTIYYGMAADYMTACVRYALMAVPMFFIIGNWLAGIESRLARSFVGGLLFYGGFYWARVWFEIFLRGDWLA